MRPEDQVGARFGLAHHTDPKSTVTNLLDQPTSSDLKHGTHPDGINLYLLSRVSPLYLPLIFIFQPQIPNLLPLPRPRWAVSCDACQSS